MPRRYDKLVRDRIPERIEESGEHPVVHSAEGDEYEQRLREKLDEEVQEYRERRDVEELADVFEVVHALRERQGVSAEELSAIRRWKARRRGRFRDGVVLERVEE